MNRIQYVNEGFWSAWPYDACYFPVNIPHYIYHQSIKSIT